MVCQFVRVLAIRVSLDTEGLVRLEGIDPGMCEISFPRLEVGTWRRLG